MAGFIYNLLLLISLPAAIVYYMWRIFVTKKSNESWRENLGALPRLDGRPPDRKLIWLHAVSVGEVVASLPVQDELRGLLPDAIILVTTITQTGNAIARKSAQSTDAVGYFPLDYPIFVNRALNRVKPDVIVMMEGEFWPNFLATAKCKGIPIVLANGSISDRTMRRSRRWGWLMSWAVSSIDYCCMQTEIGADRVRALGARPESVRVFGSTKFDQEGGELSDEAVQALRADLGLPDGAPVFVAGSTNPGEEEPVLTAFQQMRVGNDGLRLIIAPRQIERADEIQTLAESLGLKCAKRSKKESFAEDCDVLLLDTFGELAAVYAVGEITFVGGTLIPKGGHSIIQPVLQGKPVFFGPYTFKTADTAEAAISAGVGFEVRDASELGAGARALLSDADRRAEMAASCRRLVSENRGAAGRCARLTAGLLQAQTEG